MPLNKDASVAPLSAVLSVQSPAVVAPVRFRDEAFKSRTLVLADGRTLAVEKSTVTATDEEQLALLERHPDFERVADGS
ncbi:hypothetical protein [Paraburkholderia terricola]|uniref:Uncharacterized protein n=1 Tax=Paraburkholderia terricola TaxID=169427 RepID=A0A1M6XF57_9BURK|nr:MULTISPECIES: hypothetical protein [Paraburkholderia]SDP40020.1 hypothetical protein SAMN05192547_10739 [Paraburkholderia sediminicola]SHL04586.1 hypothetical protein SAMN05192548_105536 [Paraburkholderia terricola]